MEARAFGVNDDMGDNMQCSNHPNRNNPGGICAFCLQEKLGKLLVSSSFPLPIHFSSSSSSPPSFRSDATSVVGTNGGLVTTSTTSTRTRNDNGNNDQYDYYRARIPFLLANKKKKKTMVASSATSSDRAADIVLKRSKSTTTPRRGHGHAHFLQDFSPRKRGFWSFLYHPSSSSKKKVEKITTLATSNGVSSNVRSKIETKEEEDDDDEDESPNNDASSSDHRKVSRSRSVGCGSRRFSGDFFERISNGFGDCTLRRVESQREGKPKLPNNDMKERVKCGGIFGGFIIMTSSNSSSSAYWVSSSSANHQDHVNGKSLAHGRSNKSWGWVFASPMRAFGSTKTSSKDGIGNKRSAANKNTTPNLAAIPSLLAVRG